MGISFGGWPEAIHDDFEQVKRIESAEKLKPSDLAVDAGSQTMQVQGSASDPYVVSLSECSCTDFQIRQAPCKHMYRLAMELGMMDSLPKFDKKKNGFDVKSELERYRSLYSERKISTDVFVQICTALAKVDPKPGKKDKVQGYDFETELERYRSLYRDGRISADAYVKICTALSKL